MATYQQYLGRFWLPASQFDLSDGVNTPTISIPAGYYYLTNDASDTGSQLVETVQAAMRAATGYSAATCAYSTSTGLVTIGFASSTSVTWINDDLRDALGYTGDLSSGTSHAAPSVSPYVWRPYFPASSYPTDLSQWWAVGSTSKTGRRADGKAYGVTGNTYNEARVQYTMLPEANVCTNGSNSFRVFFENVAHLNQPVRCYPDRTTTTSYTGLLASDGEKLGTWTDFAARHISGYQGLWDADLMFWEHTATAPQTIVTSQSSVWLYLDDTMPQGVSVDAEVLYRFDGTATSLTDLMGNGHDQVLQSGSTFYVPVDGFVGLGFATAEEYKAASSAAYQYTGAMTAEIEYFNEAVPTASRTLFSCAASGGTEAANELYRLYGVSSTSLITYAIEHGAGTAYTKALAAMMPVGTIQLLTLTRNTAGTTITLYLDGTQIATETVTAPTGGTSSQLTLGDRGDGTAEGWHGVIFGMRITPACFTATQVLEAYQRVRGIIV